MSGTSEALAKIAIGEREVKGRDRRRCAYSCELRPHPFTPMIYRRYAKPLADRMLATLSLLLLTPFLLILCGLIAIRMGRPVLFRQTRIGLGDRAFEFVKFRTMTNQRGSDGQLLPDAERLTRLGQLLRSTSLDEIPQLWNVVKGDMSLIGPRPLLPEYLPRYSTEQRRRHHAMPGITGWAQVNGRNGLSWEDKFRHDVWYVDNCSFKLDLKILAMTFVAVFARRGISRQGHATVPAFMGAPSAQENVGPGPRP